MIVTLIRACFAAALVLQSPLAPQESQQRFRERVDVGRVLIDARALDDRGEPLLGLTPSDFRVKIDGAPVRVESATWIGEGERALDAAASDRGSRSADPAANHHRLIVFLFQKDLEPSRIFGLMRMLLKSRDLLETLTPGDRVAVLSFDTRLLVWTDFTGDRERLQRLLGHDVLLGRPPIPEPSPAPSLLAHLDPEEARTTYGIEGALELIGAALEPLPGAKTLVLIGHGFGRLGAGGMTMENDYGAAAQALVASRTSVFSLDVTEADAHSLEVGLQIVSSDTGGFYARTHIFPNVALRRMAGALAGYYVLLVEGPEDSRPMHDIDVTLTHRKGRVLAARRYADRSR